MGWEGTRMLTHGEHDELWRNAFTVIPGMAASLRRSNAIECAKILHESGKMSDESFCEIAAHILKAEGFNWSE